MNAPLMTSSPVSIPAATQSMLSIFVVVKPLIAALTLLVLVGFASRCPEAEEAAVGSAEASAQQLYLQGLALIRRQAGDGYGSLKSQCSVDPTVIDLIQRAAERGSMEALTWMAYHYDPEYCEIRNDQALGAHKWYVKSLQLGSSKLIQDMVSYYSHVPNALFSDPNYPNIVSKILQLGRGQKIYFLDDLLYMSQKHGVDFALDALKQLANEGDSDASWRLGHMYEAGDSVKQNDNLSIKYFQKCVMGKLKGDNLCDIELKKLYDRRPFSSNEEEFYFNAAQNGNAASEWLTRAVERGSTEALWRLE